MATKNTVGIPTHDQVGNIPLYHFMGPLAPDHFVVQVQKGMMEKAVELFIQFGYFEMVFKRVSWDDGQARFLQITTGGYPYIQLTELTNAPSNISILPVVHLGLAVSPRISPVGVVDLLKAWAQEQKIRFETD